MTETYNLFKRFFFNSFQFLHLISLIAVQLFTFFRYSLSLKRYALKVLHYSHHQFCVFVHLLTVCTTHLLLLYSISFVKLEKIVRIRNAKMTIEAKERKNFVAGYLEACDPVEIGLEILSVGDTENP